MGYIRAGSASVTPTTFSLRNGGSVCRFSGTSVGSVSVGNLSSGAIWTIGSPSTTATRGFVL